MGDRGVRARRLGAAGPGRRAPAPCPRPLLGLSASTEPCRGRRKTLPAGLVASRALGLSASLHLLPQIRLVFPQCPPVPEPEPCSCHAALGVPSPGALHPVSRTAGSAPVPQVWSASADDIILPGAGKSFPASPHLCGDMLEEAVVPRGQLSLPPSSVGLGHADKVELKPRP